MENEFGYNFAAIIPARYASSRFPGKPLVMIAGKTMIRRVYEQSQKSVGLVYVATDDERIYNSVKDFGGNAIMTSSSHLSGTDRCAEAAVLISDSTGIRIDVVLNIQGDEPFIRPEQIDLLKSCFKDKKTEIATLVRKTLPGEDIFNPNHPKVILDSEGNAIYFSRSVIPFYRDSEPAEWSGKHAFLKHIGLYGYSTGALEKITKLPRSPLEVAESLEQNRWLENGFRIKTAMTEWESVSIDTPEDLKKAVAHSGDFI
jgi:3-deoxy-manno-octulosonate cytidylyltransferase (CMP-KDO synthetase)